MAESALGTSLVYRSLAPDTKKPRYPGLFSCLVRKARTLQHFEVTVYKRLRGFTTAKVSMRYLWTGKSIYEVSMGGTPVL